MSQSQDNSRTSNAADASANTGEPTYVWRVNVWKLWLQAFAIAMMPNSAATGAWLLSPSSERSLPGFLLSLALVFVFFGLMPLAVPWRCEATHDSLVLVRGIGRTTYPRSAIRGVCTFHSSKRPIRTLLLRTRTRLPSLRDCFPEHEAIFDTLASLYGTCECTPELEPDSPLWKSIAEEYAEHAMIRKRFRFAILSDIVGTMSLIAIAVTLLKLDAVVQAFLSRTAGSDFWFLAFVVTFASATAFGVVTLYALALGGSVRECIATRDSLTIRRTLRTTIIPRDRILFAEPRGLESVAVFLKGRRGGTWLIRIVRNRLGAARWRFPAALIWLYGRAPTHTPSTNALPS